MSEDNAEMTGQHAKYEHKRKLRRQRENAIKRLRETGMTDAEIEAALGHPLKERERSHTPVNEGTSENRAEEDDNVVDVEIVDEEDDPSTEQAINRNLPAVIKPKNTAQQQDSIKYPQWSEEWWQHAKPEVRQRRCKAHRRSGDQCLKAANNGATVCRYHGGAARQVKMAARARLENAADRMAKELLGMATATDISDAVKLAAIKDALDRGGLKAPNEVVVSPGQTPAYQEIFDSMTTMTREESRLARGYTDELDSERTTEQSGPDHGGIGLNGDYDPLAAPLADSDAERDRRAARPHIVGDEAMRMANAANVAAGAFGEQRAIESPHRRYSRPMPPGRSCR